MKNILNYILASTLFLALWSCEDVTDEFNGLDDAVKVTNVKSIDYTLTDDDYESIGGSVATYKNFSSSNPASDYVPDLLGDLYPSFDENSSVNVTYNYYESPTVDEDGAYEITDDNYTWMGQSYSNFSDEDVAEASIVKFVNNSGEWSLKTEDTEATFKYTLYAKSDIRYFQVNDDWSVEVLDSEPDSYYTLTDDDYDLLDESYGNFYTTSVAKTQLAKFAQMTEGKGAGNYAAEVYLNYYDKYVVLKTDGETWSVLASVNDKVEQYVLYSSGWMWDPTVQYTMIASDYQTIVDYVASNIDASYLDSYKTAESYYGASAYYKEFRISDGYFEKDVFSTWQEAVSEAIQTALLPTLYSDAVATINDVDVYYIITFETYVTSMVTHTMKFQCTKSSPDPEFTYVEESETEK